MDQVRRRATETQRRPAQQHAQLPPAAARLSRRRPLPCAAVAARGERVSVTRPSRERFADDEADGGADDDDEARRSRSVDGGAVCRGIDVGLASGGLDTGGGMWSPPSSTFTSSAADGGVDDGRSGQEVTDEGVTAEGGVTASFTSTASDGSEVSVDAMERDARRMAEEAAVVTDVFPRERTATTAAAWWRRRCELSSAATLG